MHNVNKLRDILLDQQQFAELARFFIRKSSHEHAIEEGDSRFGEYLEGGLNMLLDENLKLVFELTESPIETIFINSLVLGFIKADPLNLVVQHSVRNAPRQIEVFREHRAKFKKFMNWYKNKYGTMEEVVDYLKKEQECGKMEIGEFYYLWRHYVFYELYSLENRFHMVIQPGIPDIKVEGRTVRGDLLFWIPSNDSVRVIVECDGFQYHKEKAVFVHDRKRDRALKAKGYEVLRFSGTEIFTDPMLTSAELLEYLWSIKSDADA